MQNYSSNGKQRKFNRSRATVNDIAQKIEETHKQGPWGVAQLKYQLNQERGMSKNLKTSATVGRKITRTCVFSKPFNVSNSPAHLINFW